jgi:serine/threonine protein kinase
MSLQPGTALGSYTVTAKIGEGGMGEVYRARDTKLDRDVALKVLPEAFTADPDRLGRFEREAKVLASLNHPNIGGIHGLEDSDGVKALVLELIEGPTLANRIKQGPIPIDEALPIAKQIAGALEAAHGQGVIHRDLKPANIKVKPDGTVKVLDFGLAKALQPEVADPNLSLSPTISLTAAATQMGMVIGTAAYMAPEQAKGRPVDKRADVWAFGVVLFEMLTGDRPFKADDVSLTLARVLDREPDWDALDADLPPALRVFLERCLAKDPKERVRDIGERSPRRSGSGPPHSRPLCWRPSPSVVCRRGR